MSTPWVQPNMSLATSLGAWILHPSGPHFSSKTPCGSTRCSGAITRMTSTFSAACTVALIDGNIYLRLIPSSTVDSTQWASTKWITLSNENSTLILTLDVSGRPLTVQLSESSSALSTSD